jgi:ferric-dicitrate binding protein FerR (iron transport regulator)
MILTKNRPPDRAVYWVDRMGRPHDSATTLEFGRWLDAFPQNRRDYLDQLELDDLLGRMPPSGNNVDDDELFAAAAKEFQDETNADEDSDEIDPDNPPGVASRISLMLANAPWKQITASSICALLIAGIAFFYLTRWVDYSADAASRTVKLQDGSTAVLLPHSHIRMRIRLGERQFVQETGASSLDVHHDSSQPFFVDTPEARVEAVGTRFNVNRVGDRTDIYLREGALRLHGRRVEPVRMSDGQFTQISDRGDITPPRTAEEMRARPNLLLNVDGKTLEEVAKLPERSPS